MLTGEPTLFIDSRCTLGEGPRWHAQERALYWVDIAENRLHRWDSMTDRLDCRTFDQPVACFAFRAQGGLLLGMKDGCAVMDEWDAAPVPVGAQILAARAHHRMNDGRTDPAGRFWVGSVNSTKDAPDAALYRLDATGELTEMEGGMLTCNGAAFFDGLSRPQADAAPFDGLSRPQADAAPFDGLSRPQADAAVWRFAHADTPSHAVRLYDCDPATGTLSRRRVLHQFTPGVGPGLGRPDGGSFDMQGCYWTALFDGWRVVRLSPAGELLQEVCLPVQRPTMIAFGGPDGCTAFVTTATAGLTAQEIAAQPGAGGVFAFRVDCPGVPEWPAAL